MTEPQKLVETLKELDAGLAREFLDPQTDRHIRTAIVELTVARARRRSPWPRRFIWLVGAIGAALIIYALLRDFIL